MHNLIKNGDNYSKTSGSLWKYCKDKPAVNDNGAIVVLMRLMLLICLILKEK